MGGELELREKANAVVEPMMENLIGEPINPRGVEAAGKDGAGEALPSGGRCLREVHPPIVE
eukprot:5183842-Alexandrium_andersonii.AAC.1